MPQIIPIKDLKDTAYVSEMCHVVAEPIFVTKNGYGDMVQMSIELYEKLNKQWSLYKDIEISEEQITNGNVMDARESVKKLKEKYGV